MTFIDRAAEGGAERRPILEIHGGVKKFAAVTALRQVDLVLHEREILALLGDNGAGKSTLIRCLSGVHRLDEGQMLLDGQPISPRTPTEAQSLGISTVYQDLALFDNLSAAGNFHAGREESFPRWMGRFGLVRQRAMNETAREAMRRLEVNIADVRAPVALMSGGQRQAIAVARAEAFAKRIIILDEPTAALGLREARSVHRSILRLRDRGLSTIIISHNLEEVLALADRAVVLRQGRNVGEAAAVPENHELLVSLIVGGSTRDEGAGSASGLSAGPPSPGAR